MEGNEPLTPEVLQELDSLYKYCKLKKSALSRRKEFNLTPVYIADLFNRYGDRCPACNIAFSRYVQSGSKSLKQRKTMKLVGTRKALPTVDRINADLGYIMGNVQVLCYSCNDSKKRANRYYPPLVHQHPAAHGLEVSRHDLIADISWHGLTADLGA